MLVQNKIFTAESPRTQRGSFCWRRDTAKQKGFCSPTTRFLIGAIAIKQFRSQSRREEAFDPIAVSRLDQKKISLCDLRASAVNLILRGVNVNRKIQ